MCTDHMHGTPSGGWSHFSGFTKNTIVEASSVVECSPKTPTKKGLYSNLCYNNNHRNNNFSSNL